MQIREGSSETGPAAGIAVEILEEDRASLKPIEELIDRRAQSRTSVSPVAPTARIPVNVLVVDDKEEYRNLAAEPFRTRGDRVRTARDGLEALTLCLQEPPEVILSDLEMPRMDGWNLLRVVRSRPTLAGTPFVFLTVLGGDEDRIRGYQLGVDDYIPKPYRPEEIQARVDRLVARTRGASVDATGSRPLRGDLRQVALASVLGFLEIERKTGILNVTGPGRARLSLEGGRLLRVEVDGSSTATTAVERLDQVLRWREGQFELLTCEVAGEDEFHASIASLLIEFTHRQDERRRGEGPLS